MGNLAIIKNGVVENTLAVADDARPALRARYESQGYIVVDNAFAGPGYAYLGGTSFEEPVVAPLAPTVPSTVSMYQARIALHQAGLLATVQAGIAQMSEDAQIKWEFAPTVKRDDALTVALASALNLTDEQLDALFTAAAGIV